MTIRDEVPCRCRTREAMPWMPATGWGWAKEPHGHAKTHPAAYARARVFARPLAGPFRGALGDLPSGFRQAAQAGLLADLRSLPRHQQSAISRFRDSGVIDSEACPAPTPCPGSSTSRTRVELDGAGTYVLPADALNGTERRTGPVRGQRNFPSPARRLSVPGNRTDAPTQSRHGGRGVPDSGTRRAGGLRGLAPVRPERPLRRFRGRDQPGLAPAGPAGPAQPSPILFL